MTSIQVLLSAYNGERFLREQLQSVLNQQDIDVHVLIRDDGSADGTAAILREYESYDNVKVIFGQNVGVVQSFFELIKHSGGGFAYYAFCDQDDVWLPDKLSRAAAALEAEDGKKPLLYTARAELVNAELRHLGYSGRPRKGVSFYNAMAENVSMGNTQVFNNGLRELLLKTGKAGEIAMHDHFAYLLASAFGKVIYDDALVNLYRQHGKNAIGMGKNAFAFLKTKVQTVLTGKLKRIPRQLKFFLNLYGHDLRPEFRAEAQRFLEAGNFFKRIRYVFTKKAFCQNPLAACIFWALYVFGFLSLKS